MPSVSLPVALVATAGAGLIGAGISSSASQTAANDQTAAENNAADILHQQYLQTRSDLLPYNTAGQQAVQNIQGMGPFSFQPTETQLEATPGYQFNLDQGLKAVQNSAASRGLGVSGAAQKGAASYASGLADTTYQNQFANKLATYNENLAQNQQLAGLGESAAAQTGAYGTQTAQSIGQTAVGIGNAQAAGAVGTANAISGGIGGIGNSLLSAALLGQSGGGLYGGTTGIGGTP